MCIPRFSRLAVGREFNRNVPENFTVTKHLEKQAGRNKQGKAAEQETMEEDHGEDQLQRP
jgi:hypothetical protein